jgi:hypothetical protein
MKWHENNTSNKVWPLYMDKQRRMIASSESSAPPDDEYGFQAASYERISKQEHKFV